MHNRVIAASIACLFSMSLPGFAQGNSPDLSAGCSRLEQIHLSRAKVTEAGLVDAGSFSIPGKPDSMQQATYSGLPSFCRAVIRATPSSDSDIAIEVWMPVSGWNGKFKAVGNGGFAGYMNYTALAGTLSQGYAAASTDTGHLGVSPAAFDSKWALHHPEKVADFGYRAVHLMTVDSKIVIQAFYSRKPAHSYFASCSNGGRQGLMEAQRFPADYDGILDGAPAFNWTSFISGGLDILQAFDGPGYIPAAKIPAIAHAVVEQCDGEDGVRDGIISDPPQCQFDAAQLLCKGADASDCLTAPQVASLTLLYNGTMGVKGDPKVPGFSPGGEDGPGGWKPWITGNEKGRSAGGVFVLGSFQNMVYGDPAWSYKGKKMAVEYAEANRKIGHLLNAVEPNLKPFEARGGKLILYHGWSDAALPPEATILYYQQVAGKLGQPQTDSFLRLYLAPGMQHCGGGPGPNLFGQSELSARTDAHHDIYTALEQWVESGTAPSEIVATKYTDDDPKKPVQMTRPLCPYPQRDSYSGSGDTNDAASFRCVAPSQP